MTPGSSIPGLAGTSVRHVAAEYSDAQTASVGKDGLAHCFLFGPHVGRLAGVRGMH